MGLIHAPELMARLATLPNWPRLSHREDSELFSLRVRWTSMNDHLKDFQQRIPAIPFACQALRRPDRSNAVSTTTSC